MPELPEVETACRGIEPHVVGKQVKLVEVRQPKLRWPVPLELNSLLVGKTIQSVQRRGKYLLLQFDSGSLMIHLGMSGNLRVVDSSLAHAKHDHVDICLTDGQVLRLNDPRRFGSVLWQRSGEVHSLLAQLGPEPLSDEFNTDYFVAKAKSRSTAIKTFVMDSKIVVGVGNIYANEALFAAGIHPKRAAGKISVVRIEILVAEIKRSLARAIEQGGTTLKDFVGSDGKPGYFKQQLNVYGRSGQPCSSCTKPLKEIRLGQRSTVYCTYCQS